MYSAYTITDYILWWCQQNDTLISNLKLQKILYLIQANFLYEKGVPCFRDDIEAWSFGVVVPNVYHKYKVYGGASIPIIKKLNCPHCIYNKDKVLIDEILDWCKQYSSASLTNLTMNQTPWEETYVKGCNNIISNESIKKFFS